MEELNFLNPTELLEKIYETLCSEYEDEAHYKNDEDKQDIEVTKKRLTKKVFNEFVVEDEYFLTMDPEKYNAHYLLYEKDFLRLIAECSENRISYEKFTHLVDLLMGSAQYRMNAFEQLAEEIQRKKEEEALEEEEEEIADEAEEVEEEEEE